MKERRTICYIIGRSTLPYIWKLVYRCKVIGKENVPTEGSVIVASSHVSAADPILLPLVTKRQVHYMAKDKLFANKFIGAILRSTGAFPVSRGTGGEDALKEADALMNKKRLMGIFIEGTRSKTGELLKPKTGISAIAYNAKATVVPVSIIGEGGVPIKPFKKNIIKVGKPIKFEDLGIDEQTGMHFRRGAKKIMTEITSLREEAIKLMED